MKSLSMKVSNTALVLGVCLSAALCVGIPLAGAQNRGVQSPHASGDFALRAVIGSPAPSQLLLSPDGQRLISAGRDDLVRVWEVQTMQELLRFGHHGAAIHRIASHEGLLLAGDADGVTRAYDLATGDTLYSMPGNGRPIIALAAGPGVVATGALHGPLQTFDADTGRPLDRVDGPAEWFARATFDLPRGRAASTGEGGDVRIWNLHTGAQLHLLPVGGVETTQLAFSPDGRLLAGGDWDGHVRVWEVQSGELVHTFAGVGRAGGICFSGDSQRLYMRGANDSPIEADLSTGETREFPAIARWTGLPTDQGSSGAGAAQDEAQVVAQGTYWGRADAAVLGDSLVVAWGDTLRAWQVQGTGSTLAGVSGAWQDTGLAALTEVAVSQDGAWVAAADTQGRVKIYSSQDGSLHAQLVLPEGPALGLDWSPDGESLAVAGPDRLVRVWAPLSGQHATVLFGHDQVVQDLAFAPDGSLWSGDAAGVLHRWDVASRQSLKRVQGPSGGVGSLEVSRTGEVLVFPSAAGEAPMRVRPDGETLPLSSPSKATMGTWGPTGTRYLSTTGENLVRRSAQGEVLESGGTAVRPTALDWEAGQVAVGTKGGSVALLSADRLVLEQTLRGQSQQVSAVGLSQDGRVLAAGSLDGTLRIWVRP